LVRPSFFAGEKELDFFATGLGVGIVLLGEIVRCLTIGLVYIKRGGRDSRIYANNLVTEGIYAHTRNPMYTGNLFIALGFCLMYGSAWMYGVVFPFFLLVYMGIVFEEERFLREKFGLAYENYCRNTNRFLPRLHGLAQTIKQYHFDWKKVIKKEFGTIFGSLFGAYMVLAFKYRYLYGPVGILGRPGLLILFTVPLFILYGTARFLKNTRRL
ncbi:MAG TPA: isoprenylcysteine carboxylmethyltransferase family protein, partial [Thermodesulfobacteriota bacterium]|nr:isoprenylcysteine carboxylmethyltransferase family protein [Thermodesulfobacteriota bacterium]